MSHIAILNGNKTVIKYSKIDESDKEKYNKEPVVKSKQEDICKRKEELIEQTKLLSEKGYSITEISRELDLDRRTVKKYLESDGRFNHASKGRKFKSIQLALFVQNTFHDIFVNLIEILISKG